MKVTPGQPSQPVEKVGKFSWLADHRHMSGIEIDRIDLSKVLDHPILRVEAETCVEGQSDIGAGNRVSQPGEIGWFRQDPEGFGYEPSKGRCSLSSVHVVAEHWGRQVRVQNTTTINEPVAQSFGDYRSAGAEATQHFTQRCAMRGNRARNEDQLPQSSRDCLGDAGKREAGHRMADQGHIGQIFLNDLISYGCDEIGDCERGQIAGPGTPARQVNRDGPAVEMGKELFPA